MNLLFSIGDTPLIRLSSIVPKSSAELWIKYERNDPTGSYKDRMAYGVIKAAMNRGDLKAGDRICEYTPGSTGTSIAFVASLKQGDTTQLLPISNFHKHARFPSRKRSAPSAISKLSNKKYPMYHTHYASTP